MKQLLFLLLFPCLALAQYQGNANQKITLGEQTTADGLVFRGVASIDTVTATSKITRANKQDTSAYILLDTVTNLLWHYKIGSNAWTQAGGSTLDTATMLLPYYRAGRNTIIQASDVPTLNQNTTGSAATLTTGRTIQTNLASTSAATFNGSANITPGVTGILPLGNGGTGSASQNFVDLSTNQTVNGLKTFSSIFKSTATVNAVFSAQETGTAAKYLIIRNTSGGLLAGTEGTDGDYLITNSPAYYGVIVARSGLLISANDSTEHMRIKSDGEVNIGWGGTDNGAYKLQVNSQILATSSTVATPSDKKYKENITPLTKGLEIVNKLKPVTFNFVNDTENNFSEYEEVGFIAQDVDRALSAESFAKSIVKQTDDSDPNSTYLIGTGNLIPILTKAIQEQQALIKALEQRILTLENK